MYEPQLTIRTAGASDAGSIAQIYVELVECGVRWANAHAPADDRADRRLGARFIGTFSASLVGRRNGCRARRLRGHRPQPRSNRSNARRARYHRNRSTLLASKDRPITPNAGDGLSYAPMAIGKLCYGHLRTIRKASVSMKLRAGSWMAASAMRAGRCAIPMILDRKFLTL